MSVLYRLMSHNVWDNDKNRPEWEEKGEDCSAEVRVKGLLRVYKETAPDVIGGQEFSALMADLLVEGLAELGWRYTLVWGRCTPILYRSDKFELLDSEFGSYPEAIEGFEGSFNNHRTKSWNLAVLRSKENGQTFVFATTHLWWKKSPCEEFPLGHPKAQPHSDEARAIQLASLGEKVDEYREKYSCPAVIVGDMNTVYSAPAIQNILGRGYRHAHDIATDFADDTVGRHNCYPWGYETYYWEGGFARAIDHILVRGEPDGAVKRFERYSPEYFYPISDHSAVYIDIEL